MRHQPDTLVREEKFSLTPLHHTFPKSFCRQQNDDGFSICHLWQPGIHHLPGYFKRWRCWLAAVCAVLVHFRHSNSTYSVDETSGAKVSPSTDDDDDECLSKQAACGIWVTGMGLSNYSPTGCQ